MWLILYYFFAQHIPMHPFPGWQIGYSLRFYLCKKLLKYSGNNLIVKNRCYFGKGNRLSVGDRSQLVKNARLNGSITIGEDIVMGPDVVMMATSHEYSDTEIPINKQDQAEEKPINIGNNVWILHSAGNKSFFEIFQVSLDKLMTSSILCFQNIIWRPEDEGSHKSRNKAH